MIEMGNAGRLVFRYAAGIAGLKKSDVWLASFPRVGSTWVRFILCNLISLSELNSRKVDFHLLDATMPALGYSDLLSQWKFKNMPRFVKTHQPYRPFIFYMPKRAVYILRDPRDVMVSYYHFRLDRNVRRAFGGNFAEFIRLPQYGLEACIRHYISWRPHVNYTIYYEELYNDTVKMFQKLFTTLNITVREDFLRLAVERSSFDNLRSIEEETGVTRSLLPSSQFRFLRKGTLGQWPDFFSTRDCALYQRLCQKYGFDVYT